MLDTLRKRFTVDDYFRMVDAGILSEDDRVELIDGEVVAMMPIGPPHSASVSRATRALVRAVGDHAIVRPQSPVRLGLYHAPEPDLALLRPRDDFYASRHPVPDDILLVIEVADSSLAYDRSVKARVYAETAVHEYWVVDVSAGVLWRYASSERGAYRHVDACHRGQSIAPQLLPESVVLVDALLAGQRVPGVPG